MYQPTKHPVGTRVQVSNYVARIIRVIDCIDHTVPSTDNRVHLIGKTIKIPLRSPMYVISILTTMPRKESDQLPLTRAWVNKPVMQLFSDEFTVIP